MTPSPGILELLQAGLTALNSGRNSEAETAFRRALAKDPVNVDALHLLGLVQLRLGQHADAARSLTRAVDARPSEASFRSNLALALKAAGNRKAALAQLRETVRRAPGYIQAWLNLGNTLREDRQFEAAAAAYREALKAAPDAPLILNNLGNVQREMGDFAGAVATYRRAVAIAPGYVDALTNMGSAALAGGEIATAIEVLDRAAVLDPNNGLVQILLGRSMVYATRVEEAEKAYKRAIEISPADVEPRSDLAELYGRLGLVSRAVAELRELDALAPSTPDRLSTLLFLANYEELDDPMRIVEEARRYGRALDRSYQITHRALDRGRNQPLRVGLVSSDFRDHVVMKFLVGVLPHIDRTRAELFAYSSTPVRDELTGQLRQIIPNWLDAEKLDDLSLARQIADDRIDVLVDLGGHTEHTRLSMFAMRPAPVQVTWLGYSGTTGVPEIDYIIGDAFVIPANEEPQLVETPWRMPDSYLCFTPPKDDVDVGPLPALAAGHITFGSFNNLGKLSEGTLALWARVLNVVPGSRLLIKSPPLSDPRVTRENAARFLRHGIDADRVTFAGRIPGYATHLDAYNRVDIALDPFPYNGTTTSAEALWMGVPVLSLRGNRFIGHVGESMLVSAGLSDWVATDPDDYLRKVVSFTTNLTELAQLRARLRSQMLASPLCDSERFARNLVDAFRGMWQAKCGTPQS